MKIESFGKTEMASAYALKHEYGANEISKGFIKREIEDNVFRATLSVARLVSWNVSDEFIQDSIYIFKNAPDIVISAQAGTTKIYLIKDGETKISVTSDTDLFLQISFPITIAENTHDNRV